MWRVTTAVSILAILFAQCVTHLAVIGVEDDAMTSGMAGAATTALTSHCTKPTPTVGSSKDAASVFW